MTAEWSRALVTGASAGVGAAFARELASRGIDLVLVARNEKALQALADELSRRHGVTAEVMPADLADPASLDLIQQRVESGPFVDLLVNNAGIGTFGAFERTDIDQEMRTVTVNSIAPMRLSYCAIRRMQAEGRGAIITVSSFDGLEPTPYHSVYGATKAFVNSLFEALHEELRRSPITITTVLPGYVRTEFTARAGLEGALDRVPNWLLLAPERVVSDALADAASGKATSVPGRVYKVPGAVLGVLPRRLGRRIFAALAPERTPGTLHRNNAR